AQNVVHQGPPRSAEPDDGLACATRMVSFCVRIGAAVKGTSIRISGRANSAVPEKEQRQRGFILAGVVGGDHRVGAASRAAPGPASRAGPTSGCRSPPLVQAIQRALRLLAQLRLGGALGHGSQLLPGLGTTDLLQHAADADRAPALLIERDRVGAGF